MITNEGFVLKTAVELRDEIIASVRATAGGTGDISEADFENPESLINQFTTIIADKMAEQYRVMQDVYESRFISLAIGETLNNLALNYGVQRRGNVNQVINVALKIDRTTMTLPVGGNPGSHNTPVNAGSVHVSGVTYKNNNVIDISYRFINISNANHGYITFHQIVITSTNDITSLNGLTFYENDTRLFQILSLTAADTSIPNLDPRFRYNNDTKTLELLEDYRNLGIRVSYGSVVLLDAIRDGEISIEYITPFTSEEFGYQDIMLNSEFETTDIAGVSGGMYYNSPTRGSVEETDLELRNRIYSVLFPSSTNVESLRNNIINLVGVKDVYIETGSSGTYLYVLGGARLDIANEVVKDLNWNITLLASADPTLVERVTSSDNVPVIFNRPKSVTGIVVRIVSINNVDRGGEHASKGSIYQFIESDITTYVNTLLINEDFILDRFLIRTYNNFNFKDFYIKAEIYVDTTLQPDGFVAIPRSSDTTPNPPGIITQIAVSETIPT